MWVYRILLWEQLAKNEIEEWEKQAKRIWKIFSKRPVFKEIEDNDGMRMTVLDNKYYTHDFKFSEFESMWTKQVVPHPLATYLKLQWDNDWDHIFFISMLWDWWDIIAKDILDRNDIWDLFSNIKKDKSSQRDLVTPWFNDNFSNKINITEQVDKESKVEIEEWVWLLEKRY